MNTKDKSWKILSLIPIIAVLVILTLVPLVNIFYNSFFDIRWDDGKYNYTYIRNSFAFRGGEIDPKKIEIIMVGGSTTDERYKPENLSIVGKLEI